MTTHATPHKHFTNPDVLSRITMLPASPDLLLSDTTPTAPEVMESLILENIGGTEIIESTRNTYMSGINAKYSPISNLSELSAQYQPSIITMPAPGSREWRRLFEINLDESQLNDWRFPGPIATRQYHVRIQTLQDNDDLIEVSVAPVKRKVMMKKIKTQRQTTTKVKGGKAASTPSKIVNGGKAVGYNIDMSIKGGNVT